MSQLERFKKICNKLIKKIKKKIKSMIVINNVTDKFKFRSEIKILN